MLQYATMFPSSLTAMPQYRVCNCQLVVNKVTDWLFSEVERVQKYCTQVKVPLHY